MKLVFAGNMQFQFLRYKQSQETGRAENFFVSIGKALLISYAILVIMLVIKGES